MNFLVQRDRSRNIRSFEYASLTIKSCFFLIIILSFTVGINLNTTTAETSLTRNDSLESRKLIILSIDGFPAYYLKSTYVMDSLPNLKKFFSNSVGGRVKTVDPSLTYPAHTSMITGVDPGIHGIEGNTPIDPYNIEDGAWLWYRADNKSKTIVDYAKDIGLSTASVFWPVSVGRFTDWNIPQIWRTKTEEDWNLLSQLSTPELFMEMKTTVGIPVSEITKDDAKIRTGLQIFKDKNPNLLLIYSTDVDSFHHWKGPYSPEALARLKATDTYLGELIDSIDLYNRKDLGLIIVSDHGFHTATRICRPNRHLIDMGMLNPNKKDWFYYFKSSGGLAYLISNPQYSKTELPNIDLMDLNTRLQKTCPTTKFYSNGDAFLDRKRNSHPKALAFLESNKSVFLSSSWDDKYFSTSEKGIHTHGFPSNFEQMDTIAFFYGNPSEKVNGDGDNISMTSVKDVFKVSCNWLKLSCPKQ
ncbi:alkaline phosphatase family protein [Leptospira sp. GIMC2001]|uniref:alkaline phosphatase family protein n=1 Tax=Leptospira sp. GIMC2001 TaxID=1513297 RepID=UPI00234B0A75|nr:ectonucleotide pyrophosphatase/phosphodiesterase [Leptospira sp. GIMC2001]WCL47874.1 ectonucleotide pyrophosphatase/phosphodiesterase [Leptospira sp. GIMC2001]